MKEYSAPGRFFPFAAPLLLAALFCAAAPCRAQDAPRFPNQHENRFLFIVDTSAAMRACSNASVRCVAELLASDMRGEFRKGDTIGLWTYNDSLHTEFPMQIWSRSDKSAIADEVTAYLRGRRYGKRAHLETVLPALNEVIQTSERLTVVLISDGAGSMQGTRFDREINRLEKRYARELRAAREPFVLVLIVRDGAVSDYTINYPGLVAIPHTAKPEAPDETNAPALAAGRMPPPPPIPPPHAPRMPRQMRSIIMSSATNAARAPAPPPAATAAPVAPPPPPVTLPVTPLLPPLPPATAPPAPAPPAGVIAPAPAAPVLAVAPAPAPAMAAVIPAAAAPAATVAPTPPGKAPAPAPAPPPVVARPIAEPAAAAPAPQAPPASAAATAPQPAPAPTAARTAPVANITPAGSSQFVLYVMAFSLLTIAAVLVVFLVRRSRKVPQPSLISQSIDRPR
jgi:cytochrome c-type biogenesis protein CcmH/NrfF